MHNASKLFCPSRFMICKGLFCKSIEPARKGIPRDLSSPLSRIKLLEPLSKGCKFTARQLLDFPL